MPIIPVIIEQHAEEAAFKWLLRNGAVSEPHYDLADLAHLDDRVEANIDGLRIAGDEGWEICKAAMALEEPGEIFTAGVIALGSRDFSRVDEVLAAVESDDELFRALVSAIGWLDLATVAEPANKLINADVGFLKHLGLSTFAIHRHDPGPALFECLMADDTAVRARALKAVGELGRGDLLNAVQSHFAEMEDKCLFYAAWSAGLLGDLSSVSILSRIAESDSPYAQKAGDLAVRLMTVREAHSWLEMLSNTPDRQRLTIKGYGALGDPAAIPLVMEYMAVPELARVAGEAFSMITGVDIAYEDLEGEWPDRFQAGPTEEAEDEDVGMDPDEDLPWPATELIQNWWHQHKGEFKNGSRYILGKPISEDSLQHGLVHGFQRQRASAAIELALQRPNAALFEVRAPGFRQQKVLAI